MKIFESTGTPCPIRKGYSGPCWKCFWLGECHEPREPVVEYAREIKEEPDEKNN